jgi:dipeptidyl aminopeptidase/acylaminoacyl peptidase
LPISAEQVARAAVSFDAVQMHGSTVFWIEGRPEGDVLVSWSPVGGSSDVLPEGISVGSRVHEYGGGAYLVTKQGIWFSRADDQRIWRTTLDGVVPVTAKDSDCRYADMRVTVDGLVVCVRERHEPEHVVNELVAMPALSCTEPHVISSGWDFYSFPRPSPDGRQLAWTTWRHPFMPWDATWLWIADVGPEGRLGEPRHVAGGHDESVFQPEWSPDGVLHFVSDRSGWWNLYAYTGDSIEPVVLGETEIGVAQWEFGYATYKFLNRRRVALVLQDGPGQTLAVWDMGQRVLQPLTLPHTSIKPYLATDGEQIAVVAAAADRTPGVALIDPAIGEVRDLAGGPRPLDRLWISMPELVSFPTRDGSHAHGIVYPPHPPGAQPPHDSPPPLITRPHAGPTANAPLRLDLWTQFFTSRGFAVLDIDYRGSTGYGRAYRCALRGRWGLLDVTDCADAVSHLAEAGRIDPSRVAISGASAGGYTALRALATTDVFVAGVARSAIVDPASWQVVAPKFQAHYGDMLAGPGPEARQADYPERPVLEHASAITAPVLLIHGEHDPVVPLQQARDLARRMGDRATLIVLPGETHTIRRPANIARALHAELAHYQRAFQQRM